MGINVIFELFKLMNKLKTTYIIFILCFACFILRAQTKSTDIKTINGKKYYIHKVEKGQSLYAIAKIYNIDINSVLVENDEAIEGIKNGQELKIPFESLLPKQVVAIDTNKYVYHKVQKSETVFGICKKYNIDEKKLISFNSLLNKGLKEGEYLIVAEKSSKKNIGNSQAVVLPNTVIPIKSTVTYTVLAGETLYGISKKLNISIDEITKLNPEVKDGIKQDQILKIENNKDAVVLHMDVDSPPLVVIKDTLSFHKPKKSNYNVGLFLPFKLTESEQLIIEDLLRAKSSFPNAQNVALDFYFGFKKAVDSLISKDFDVTISLFDIQENDSAKVEALCKTAEFKKLDIVFGPLYANVFKQVTNYAKALQIPCVAPITQQSKILYNNPLVSKVNPSQFTLIESLADFSADSLYEGGNIIIVNSTQKDQVYVKAFKKRYIEDLIKLGKSIKDTIIEVKGLAGVKAKYISGKKNVVVLLTNSPVYLQDFITQLAVYSNKKDFVLLGFESITAIDNLDQGYLNDLNFHFATANHTDYSQPGTIDLVKQYQQFYFSNPSEYYFEGFDIASYYLSNLKLQGPDMFIYLDKFNYCGVASGFKFFRPDTSTGFENRAISIYKYSNYKLQKLGW